MMSIMDGISEVLVISDAGSQRNNCSIFDLKNGSSVFNCKDGGRSVPKGLAFIAEDYIISALSEKAALKIWTLTKSNAENSLMVCPGKVSCLAVTPCGGYCVAGIDKLIYLWEVASGNMLNIVPAHSQALTCLRFTSDGTFLISGGKDGLVLVWMLSLMIDMTYPHDSEKPHYMWMDHSGEITDIFVGKLGCYARVATASRDMTCKIYELESGNLLTTICTDYEITSVAMDNTEYFLLLGSAEGSIYRVNLFSVRDGDVHNSSSEQSSAFMGHTGGITCLSVSAMGTYLLSGSEDGCCRLWEMSTFSCIRKMPCEGPVTNAFIALYPPGLKGDRNYIPRLRVSVFNKEREGESQPYIYQKIFNRHLSLMHVETPDKYFDASLLDGVTDKLHRMSKSRVSVQELETINQQLYSYALCDLVTRKSTIHLEEE